MRAVLHPDAIVELEEAALWYEDLRPGLGEEFIAEIDATVARVIEQPALFTLWAGEAKVRRAVVERFPYVLFFEATETEVLVLAVAHAARRPGYWLARR